jgi:8-oxo-dGTP diphosphatase
MKLSIDVVCAVIKSAVVINKGRNDLFLIAKHAKNKIHAGKWEFPGGKIKPEENHSDAVKREVMEELGAEIEITRLQDPIKHSYNHAKIRLLPYECKLTDNSLEPQAKEMEHSELAWVECWDMW